MQLDIGGMQIYDNDKKGTGLIIKSDKQFCYFLNNGRNALNQILEVEKVKKAYVCSYNCYSVFEPFYNYGIELVLYDVDKHFNIKNLLEKLQSEKDKCIVYIQEFFTNYCLDEIKQILKDKCNIIVIEDITHSMLDDRIFENADYYVGSIRKWAGLGEGGILLTDKHLKIKKSDNEIMSLVTKMAPMQKEYIKTKNENLKIEYRKLQDNVNFVLRNKEIQSINPLALEQLNIIDFEYIKQRRRENYIYLLRKLKDLRFIDVATPNISDKTVPLYLPIYVENKFDLQTFLFKYHIYLTILWPQDEKLKGKCNKETDLMYKEMLNIHIDQRYDKADMDRIYKTFVDYQHSVIKIDN